MTKSLSIYCESIQDYLKKLVKKLTVGDIGVIKYVSFVVGLLFASWFPKFTKKLKPLFVITGIILMIPVVIKAVKTFKEVFKYRWW